ncbi:hypothetical protein G6F32_013866 [Rhizopus arrhizus]|nr:hypothetical protein G6F32_013866 [Rhizopus arrhizus]
MTGETAAAVERRPHTVDPAAETRIQQGTPAFRRTALALFLAGFSTFGLLYTVQPLLPEFSRHFGVSAAGSAMSLSLTTGTLAVAMLLAGALERVRRAQASLERGDQAGKGKAIGEVCAIVGHLNGSLDHEAGGEIAGNLSALYDYVLQRLTEANLHNDRAALDEALQLLGEIDSAWNAIPHEQRRPAAVAP